MSKLGWTWLSLCAREELHLRTRENGNSFKQKAKDTLCLEQRMSVMSLCEWLRKLSLPDGYNSNFANIVSPTSTKFQNLKSHDYHVLMEALLPTAFSTLPTNVLETLGIFSEYFKNIYASVLCEDQLIEMHQYISIILCKLDIIFLPGF